MSGFPYLDRGTPWEDAPVALTVLLIDDDPDFRGSARRVITRGGAEIVGEVASVAEGLAAAVELRPDAILVDIGLPDGDGVALARELAGLDWGPRIVLTSVDVDATTDGRARAVGAAGFVPKHELPGAGLALLLGSEE
jgi:DNA-binding NarL/FixJ family response regulator